MSKPRSRLIARADSEFRRVKGFTTAIHFGRQAKHLPGQPNHDLAKSTVTISITEVQRLVELKAGTGTWRGHNREIIDFGVEIGIYRSDRDTRGRPTTRGTVHYSKACAHVVPTAPRPSAGRNKRR